MRKRLFIPLVLAIGFTMAFQSFPSSADDLEPPVRVIVAHRGASVLAPENTIAAYKQAVADGANGAECDVRLTADGVPVLMNDASVKRTCGVDGKIAEMTLEEIRKLDAGSWKNAKFKGEKVPTLEEYLLYLKETDCHPVIEIKTGGSEKVVLDVIRKTGMLERSTVISFSQGVVKEMKRLEPKLTAAWLYGEKLKDNGTPEENATRLAEKLIIDAKSLGTNVLDLAANILSEPLVKQLREAGIHVWCYTVDDPLQMKKLLDWGVESITTNRPDRLTNLNRVEAAMKSGTTPGKGMPVRIRKNVAHRGASFVAPENTVAAYKQAIADGATGAECDLYSTSDGVVVLFHDNTTKRTLGVDGTIPTKTFEELRKLDAGIWKGEKYKGEKIATLDEYLLALKGTECYPVIEIKMGGIEQKIIDAVRKHGMLDVASVIAFSPEVVKEIRRLEPKMPIAWLYGEKLNDKGTPEENADRLFDLILWRCYELDTNMVDLEHGMLSETLIKKLQKAGIHVWCWTVNDEARMEQLLDWGIESITTDRPELLTEVLKKR